MIDFEIPEETRAIRNKVRQFVREECHPAEAICTPDNFDSVLAELRQKARSRTCSPERLKQMLERYEEVMRAKLAEQPEENMEALSKQQQT